MPVWEVEANRTLLQFVTDEVARHAPLSWAGLGWRPLSVCMHGDFAEVGLFFTTIWASMPGPEWDIVIAVTTPEAEQHLKDKADKFAMFPTMVSSALADTIRHTIVFEKLPYRTGAELWVPHSEVWKPGEPGSPELDEEHPGEVPTSGWLDTRRGDKKVPLWVSMALGPFGMRHYSFVWTKHSATTTNPRIGWSLHVYPDVNDPENDTAIQMYDSHLAIQQGWARIDHCSIAQGSDPFSYVSLHRDDDLETDLLLFDSVDKLESHIAGMKNEGVWPLRLHAAGPKDGQQCFAMIQAPHPQLAEPVWQMNRVRFPDPQPQAQFDDPLDIDVEIQGL